MPSNSGNGTYTTLFGSCDGVLSSAAVSANKYAAVPNTGSSPYTLFDTSSSSVGTFNTVVTFAAAVTVAVPNSKVPITPVTFTFAIPTTLTVPTYPVASTPVTLAATETPPSDENGALEYGNPENIYNTNHLDPDGTVTDIPPFTVIGPTLDALDPEGIE